MTIQGIGSQNLSIDGTGRGNRIFNIQGDNINVEIKGLTLTNGRQTAFISPFTFGGAISFFGSNSTLFIKKSLITDSSVTTGSAIYNGSTSNKLRIKNTVIENNFSSSNSIVFSNPGGGVTNRGELVGNSGNDRLLGGNNQDTLVGGRGRDTLIGDSGRDTFVIQNVTYQNRDIIRDFVDGTDKLFLSSGLSFNDLTIENNSSGTSTLIKNTNNTIAVLRGVDSSSIDESDFI